MVSLQVLFIFLCLIIFVDSQLNYCDLETYEPVRTLVQFHKTITKQKDTLWCKLFPSLDSCSYIENIPYSEYAEVNTPVMTRGCCPEYRSNGTDCVPICYPTCKTGYCAEPYGCGCPEGFNYKNEICVPICDPPCVNSDCTAPGICTCHAEHTRINKTFCSGLCEKMCENDMCVNSGECREILETIDRESHYVRETQTLSSLNIEEEEDEVVDNEDSFITTTEITEYFLSSSVNDTDIYSTIVPEVNITEDCNNTDVIQDVTLNSPSELGFEVWVAIVLSVFACLVVAAFIYKLWCHNTIVNITETPRQVLEEENINVY